MDSETIAPAYQKHQLTPFAKPPENSLIFRDLFFRAGFFPATLAARWLRHTPPPSRSAEGSVAAPLRARSAGPLRGAAATAAELFPSNHPPLRRFTPLLPHLHNCGSLSSANEPKPSIHTMSKCHIHTKTKSFGCHWQQAKH